MTLGRARDWDNANLQGKCIESLIRFVCFSFSHFAQKVTRSAVIWKNTRWKELFGKCLLYLSLWGWSQDHFQWAPVSCASLVTCTGEWQQWWRAPIIRASTRSGLLFALCSIRAQALCFKQWSLMIYWREWQQMQQCHPPTGRTAMHAGANENRWGVCTSPNSKCRGSKSSLISSYIFSRAVLCFLGAKLP